MKQQNINQSYQLTNHIDESKFNGTEFNIHINIYRQNDKMNQNLTQNNQMQQKILQTHLKKIKKQNKQKRRKLFRKKYDKSPHNTTTFLLQQHQLNEKNNEPDIYFCEEDISDFINPYPFQFSMIDSGLKQLQEKILEKGNNQELDHIGNQEKLNIKEEAELHKDNPQKLYQIIQKITLILKEKEEHIQSIQVKLKQSQVQNI